MTTAGIAQPVAYRPKRRGSSLVNWMTTTDHKLIGQLYLVTSFLFFLLGRRHGAADARRTGPARAAVPDERAVQPAVHDARHDHAAAVRDAAVLGLRERHHAAADRRARRRVPAAEHLQLLAVPVRRPDHDRRLPYAGWRRRLRLVRLRAADQRGSLAGRRRRPVDHGSCRLRPRHDPRCGQLHHHDHGDARARHDDVPDADLHLEHPAHLDARAARVPGARRGAAVSRGRPQTRARTSSRPPTAARSSGSTCSGSSAIPRSTSSRSRSSGSSPRSCRCSAASRCSATRVWSSRRSRSPACR